MKSHLLHFISGQQSALPQHLLPSCLHFESQQPALPQHLLSTLATALPQQSAFALSQAGFLSQSATFLSHVGFKPQSAFDLPHACFLSQSTAFLSHLVLSTASHFFTLACWPGGGILQKGLPLGLRLPQGQLFMRSIVSYRLRFIHGAILRTGISIHLWDVWF